MCCARTCDRVASAAMSEGNHELLAARISISYVATRLAGSEAPVRAPWRPRRNRARRSRLRPRRQSGVHSGRSSRRLRVLATGGATQSRGGARVGGDGAGHCAATAPASSRGGASRRSRVGCVQRRSARRLRDFARAISGEILHRLRTRVLNPSTVGSLQDLNLCVARGALDCVPVAMMAYAWVRAALANPRVAAHSRPVLYVSGAVIAGVLDQRGCAIEWLNAAVSAAPCVVAYRLRLVRELQLVGRWSAARAALDGVRANDRGGANRDRIDAFATAIEARPAGVSEGALKPCHPLPRSVTTVVAIERR